MNNPSKKEKFARRQEALQEMREDYKRSVADSESGKVVWKRDGPIAMVVAILTIGVVALFTAWQPHKPNEGTQAVTMRDFIATLHAPLRAVSASNATVFPLDDSPRTQFDVRLIAPCVKEGCEGGGESLQRRDPDSDEPLYLRWELLAGGEAFADGEVDLESKEQAEDLVKITDIPSNGDLEARVTTNVDDQVGFLMQVVQVRVLHLYYPLVRVGKKH